MKLYLFSDWMKKGQFFILILILLGAFITRLYRFDFPVADWHSWRQADTSAVSRNFVNNGFDLLHPKFDDLSNVPSGKDNPNGYRFVEFPIYNFFQAGLFKSFGVFSLEEWGRLVSIFSSLASTIFLYLIVKKYASNLAGILAAFFFAFLPFNIYFSRTILPDTTMVAAILGGTYFFDLAIKEKYQISNIKYQIYFLLSIIFTASAFLLRPYALFFTLPMIYLLIKNFGLKTFLKWEVWFFAFLTVAPLVLWRNWMTQFPEGIPDNKWLFNAGNIRFKGAFFHWIFGDRIGRLILGYWGLPLLILGFLHKLKKENYMFFLSFIFSSLLYIFTIAKGNVQHDYYQILIIPSLAIFLALGSEFLLKASKEYYNRVVSYLLLAICIIFMEVFGWYFARDFFNINNVSMVKAGKEIDSLIPKEAKVIAIYEGDTSFLYQINRKGWASFEKPIPEMIKMGANYLALPNPKPVDFGLGKDYKIISSTNDYILFDLSQKP